MPPGVKSRLPPDAPLARCPVLRHDATGVAQPTLAEALRNEMDRQDISSRELARKLSGGTVSAGKLRTVKRWRSGETASLQPRSAAALEKALGTRGVFTRFVQKPERRGTRAVLEAQIADYIERQDAKIEELERRVRELEGGS